MEHSSEKVLNEQTSEEIIKSMKTVLFTLWAEPLKNLKKPRFATLKGSINVRDRSR